RRFGPSRRERAAPIGVTFGGRGLAGTTASCGLRVATWGMRTFSKPHGGALGGVSCLVFQVPSESSQAAWLPFGSGLGSRAIHLPRSVRAGRTGFWHRRQGGGFERARGTGRVRRGGRAGAARGG